MIRFEKLAPTEKGYPFADAEAAADYKDGTFGTVAEGTFTAGAGFSAVMQVEQGEDAHTDAYTAPKGSHVRVADFSKSDGAVVDITADNIAGDYKDAKYFEVDETGLLKKAESLESKNGFEVVEATRYGFRAKVVLGASGE